MRLTWLACARPLVAPHVGAWIEIIFLRYLYWSIDLPVAPHVGAWIEILYKKWNGHRTGVAPHVGAWIEM